MKGIPLPIEATQLRSLQYTGTTQLKARSDSHRFGQEIVSIATAIALSNKVTQLSEDYLSKLIEKGSFKRLEISESGIDQMYTEYIRRQSRLNDGELLEKGTHIIDFPLTIPSWDVGMPFCGQGLLERLIEAEMKRHDHYIYAATLYIARKFPFARKEFFGD